jgi:tetratricopeptide (TPR) repeat protein
VYYYGPGAERVLRRAIALDPQAVEARLQLSDVLSATGRFDEAVRNVDEAWAIDSLNPRVGYFRWLVLYSARRYEDMLRWAERAATPDLNARRLRFFAHVGLRPDSAPTYVGASTWSGPAYRVVALAAAGRLVEARDLAARLEAEQDSAQALGRTPYVQPDWQSVAWAAVGDKDRAFAALERSYGNRSGDLLPHVKVLPFFDSLRDDPRYHDLLRRMHLEP